MRDADVKKDFRIKASNAPDKHYPVDTLKEFGFSRFQCATCERFFWSLEERHICGDPSCSGGFRFIGKPTKKPLEYIDVWRQFSKHHEKLGYSPVARYPVVARWNPTTEFTIASIAAFQPYVVTGEVAPPANPLVIPQMCLRFPDIDNVGITGHHVGFVMLGQHAFVQPKDYDVNKYLNDHISWLKNGMGVQLKELSIHEDAWAGGGNLGPSVEFFAKGIELSNQVYMQYEISPSGVSELKTKVLDMGQGMERASWFTTGKESIYECSFPSVIKKLRDATGVKFDAGFMKSFTPLSSYLNVDEAPDMSVAWKFVADKLKLPVNDVKDKILPLAGMYSVAEHSRALLVALSDGALPSNVGGMYNLRVILRRALGFIDSFKWDVDLPSVCEEHAKYLKPLYPELIENIDGVSEILDVEKKKYRATREKTQRMLPKLLDKDLSTSELVELYDSHGISPEMIRDAAVIAGKPVVIPSDFYARLSERHESGPAVTKTEREGIPLPDVSPTKPLYFDDYRVSSFDGKVLAIVGNNVVLDQTVFYPVSGGQLSDRGTLNGDKVVDVFKQGSHIVHVLEKVPKFHAGDSVHGEIDFDRRVQLAQHHTATHIVNAAAKIVLGRHVNQASAKKDVDKAHIDLTHYDALSDEQVAKIQFEANKIVKSGIKTNLSFLPREEAEKKYGMEIYQGGAVPGKLLRIVNILDTDVEACGGTHLHNTSEAGEIVIMKSSKVQDGVVRLTFAAGRAAINFKNKDKHLLDDIASLLKVDVHQIPSRAQEIFDVWKSVRKLMKKKEPVDASVLNFKSKDKFDGDVLTNTAQILQTQPDVIVKTLQRFLKDIEDSVKK